MAAMTQGSEDEPADREKSFDAAWGKLLDKAADGEAGDTETSGPKGTRFGDPSQLARDASEAREDEASAPTEAESADGTVARDDDDGAGPKGTRLGTASAIAHKTREVQAREAMDWMMTVTPEASGFGKVVVPDEDEEPAALSGEHPVAPLDKKDADEKDAADNKDADNKDADNKDAEAESKPTEATVKPAEARDQEADKDEAPVRRLDQAVGFGRAANERPSQPGAGGAGRFVIVLVAIGVVGALAWAAFRDTGDARPGPPAHAQAPTAKPTDPPPPQVPKGRADRSPTPVDAPPEHTPPPEDPTPEPADPPEDPPPADPPGLHPAPDDSLPRPTSGDLREPPPGTPEENAAAFRKLPVSPSDRAPVGGVGPSGIHVDHILMGTSYVKGQCEGEARSFSYSSGDRPSVCVRVVHPRSKEELVLLWEKKGGTTRRGKLIIPNAHAYRTRAYLVLRREYVGEWTVHVQSADGTDLATYDFTVVP